MTGRICLEDVPTMTGIRSFASLPVTAVAILALIAVALTFAPPPPPQILEASNETQPPARPTGLTLAVSGQSVTLSWDDTDVSGISYQYRVNHNDTGTGKLSGWGSWQDINNPSKTGSRFSYTISGHTLGKEYRYKIRAVNIGGESKPAPAASPWYVAAIIPDPRPPALSNLWTVRVCDDLFKVRWHFVPGATGYDLEMSGNHRQSWQRKMTNKNVNAWQFSQWTKNATFWFRVRAVNSNGASEWRYVKSIAPPCAVEGLQASYEAGADGQSGTITASWNPAHRASGYDVNFSADNGYSWQRMVTDLRATSYEFTEQIPYNPNYRVAVQARRKGVTSGWRNAPVAHLSVSNVAGTTATLNLAGHSGDWYVKKTAPTPAGACSSAISGATHDLSNLSAGTTYTYTAYSGSGCSTVLDSVTFFNGVSVSNLDETGSLDLNVGEAFIYNVKAAAGFTTGPSSNGYTLKSVTVRVVRVVNQPASLSMAIHTVSGNAPASQATHTLTGTSPTAVGDVTYTCDGSCSLDRSTSYYLVLSVTGKENSTASFYDIKLTESENETNTPAEAGWSLADEMKRKDGSGDWYTYPTNDTNAVMFKVTAVVK